jgi:hypothetical protein
MGMWVDNTYKLGSRFMIWLHNHEFLASWGSAVFGGLASIIALIGMIVQARRTGDPMNWNLITLRVAFLLILSAVISPHADPSLRIFLGVPMMFLLVALTRQ